jgi:hypothetical protein
VQQGGNLPFWLLADAVVLFHFLWILFIIFGGLWGRRKRSLGRVHIAALVGAIVIEGFDLYCPLTHLEIWLREQGAQGSYHESFIPHYLNKVIYLDVPHPPVVAATVLICLWNFWLYWSDWKGRKR